MSRSISLIAALLVAGSLAAITGCEEKPAPTGTTGAGRPADGSVAAADKHADHDHDAGDGHDDKDHDHDEGEMHDDHGPTVELGSSAIGAFQVKASRDGDIAAGGEAPIDIWVVPGAGAKVGSVRAWIGTQDAMGSMKVKLDLENDNYHAHIEVPNPMPESSKLWIEIEDDKGVKTAGSFDLKS